MSEPGACPFGVAWRASAPPQGSWQYVPPYTIPFALWFADHTRDDVARPLEFVLVGPPHANPGPQVEIHLASSARHSSWGAVHSVGAPRVTLRWPGAIPVDSGVISISA